MSGLTRRWVLLAGASIWMRDLGAVADPSGIVGDVPVQPYLAMTARVLTELDRLGAPIAAADRKRLDALARARPGDVVSRSDEILDRYTLLRIDLGPAGYRASPGSASRVLTEQGWRVFLLRVSNPERRREVFGFQSGPFTPGQFQGKGVRSLSQRAFLNDTLYKAPWIERMWSMSELADVGDLSGAPVEYRVVQVFSRDRGRRSFVPRMATRLRTYRARAIEFECVPSFDVTLQVRDADGRGCMASLFITDGMQRVYPPPAMRIAPDLPFQPQIYRADGESIRLPEGRYTIRATRGPEYVPVTQEAHVGASRRQIDVRLRRWIDPAAYGWYSGDTHIHAAGCAHYEIPTEGVAPETMIRHIRGEALSIGAILTWGPGYYHQRQFFKGHAESPSATLEEPELQRANNVSLVPQPTPADSASLIRYDVEVSGFPSSHAGHLVLLGLTDQDFPGAHQIEDWPSWNLPILQWAREQGAVAGYAHSSGGLEVAASELPNYDIPPFDSTGANEAIVDVTHGCVDFLSGCERLPIAELNIWYHLLNCGFRLAMVGETDFPCISDERPGRGRSYVRLSRPPVDEAGYRGWLQGLKRGELYWGDGRSHFLRFAVEGQQVGTAIVQRPSATLVAVDALVAARLDETSPGDVESLPLWHLERARSGSRREVAVELILNGQAVGQHPLIADGVPRPIHFEVRVERSAWIALRIMPSSHTHPLFIEIGGLPVRASSRSAQWCRDCVDVLWNVKAGFIRPSETAAAEGAFDHARRMYEAIFAECTQS